MFFRNTTFVAIDLETTGIDAEKDKIIEFAGIRVENGEVVQKLELLINPGIPIPLLSQAVTGISDADLQGKPLFEEVKKQIEDFLGNEIILGHNVQFDIAFLKQAGILLQQNFLDTYTLSSIFFPEEASLALEVLSERLQIEHKYKHRALGDILATVELLKIIYQKIQAIDPQSLEKVKKILEKSDSALKMLFQEVENQKQLSFLEEEIQLSLFHHSQRECEVKNCLTSEFKENLKLILKDQVHAILETPFQFQTALETIECCFENKQKAVVAFYSPKLINKVFQHLNFEQKQKCLILKNTTNYLCFQKWQKFLQKPKFTEQEISLAIKIELWLQKTQTGDRDEIALTYDEYALWFTEIASSELCSGSEHQECFWHQQKAKIQASEVIFTYQNLLLENIFPSERVVFNFESRNLEQTLTNSSSLNLKIDSFIKILKNLQQAEELEKYHNQIQVLIENLEIFFGYFFKTLTHHLNEFIYSQKILLTQALKAQPEILELRQILKNWFQELEKLLEILQTFSKYKYQENQLQNLQRDLHSFFEEAHENEIRYCEVFPNGNLEFNLAKVDLKELTQKILTSFKQVIFLDENLGVFDFENESEEYNFNFFKTILGINEEKFVEKYFKRLEDQKGKIDLEFLNQSTLNQNIFEKTIVLLEERIQQTPGKTVFLLNSYAALQQFFEKMVLDLQKFDFKLLAQNSGGVRKIKAIFEDFSNQSVLFGIERSFHKEFFEVEHLKNLILHKVSFDFPGDPLIEARQSKYKNAFMEFSLPRSLLNFKQNYLKLQSKEQTFIPLDQRIVEKKYGQYFLKILEKI